MPSIRARHILLLVLLLINGIIFFFRAHFNYTKYADYKEVYQANSPEKWKGLSESFSKQDLTIADSVLKANAVIQGNMSALEKTVAIGTFLRKTYQDHTGPLAISKQYSSALDLYTKTCTSNTMLHCGHFSYIFPFFCASQGIIARYIGLSDKNAAHVMNEAYIPELHKWVLVDLHYNILLARDSSNQLLDLQQLRSILRKGGSAKIQSFVNDSMLNQPVNQSTGFVKAHYLPDFNYHYYYTIKRDKTVSLSEKIKRYLLPVNWYEVYRPGHNTNILFYFKLLMLLALPASLVFNLLHYDRGKQLKKGIQR